jgi:hypothetical protein
MEQEISEPTENESKASDSSRGPAEVRRRAVGERYHQMGSSQGQSSKGGRKKKMAPDLEYSHPEAQLLGGNRLAVQMAGRDGSDRRGKRKKTIFPVDQGR